MSARNYDVQDGELVYRIPGARHGDGQVDSDKNPVWLLIADIRDIAAIARYIDARSGDEAAIRAALAV
jgi:hypothetical protein